MNLKSKLTEAMSEITRGVGEIIGIDYIEFLVQRFLEKGQRFIVKAGFDPTAPDLHLGILWFCKKWHYFKNMARI